MANKAMFVSALFIGILSFTTSPVLAEDDISGALDALNAVRDMIAAETKIVTAEEKRQTKEAEAISKEMARLPELPGDKPGPLGYIAYKPRGSTYFVIWAPMKLHLRRVKLDEDRSRLALRKECLARRATTVRDACAAMAQIITEAGTDKKVARK